MDPQQLRSRAQTFAAAIVRFCVVLGATFIAKLSIVVEEADETVGWLELLGQSGIASAIELAPYRKEATELLAIFVASRRTASGRG